MLLRTECVRIYSVLFALSPYFLMLSKWHYPIGGEYSIGLLGDLIGRKINWIRASFMILSDILIKIYPLASLYLRAVNLVLHGD